MMHKKMPAGGRKIWLAGLTAILLIAGWALTGCSTQTDEESASVPQNGSPEPGGQTAQPTAESGGFIYYWAGEQEHLNLTSAQASITRTQNVTVAPQGFGYINQHWFINGVEDTAKAGQTSYVFRGAERAPGSYTVGLRVTGGGAYYYTGLTITVTY